MAGPGGKSYGAPAPPVADPMAWARGARPRAATASAVTISSTLPDRVMLLSLPSVDGLDVDPISLLDLRATGKERTRRLPGGCPQHSWRLTVVWACVKE